MSGDKYTTGRLDTNSPKDIWKQRYPKTSADEYTTGRLETHIPQDVRRQIYHRTSFAVGFALCLQKLGVCLSAHDNCLSTTIRASRLEGTWRLKIPAIVPHNLLHEAVTSLIHVAKVGVILRLQQLWVCLHARLDLERSKLDGC